jgi:hypothetical protein
VRENKKGNKREKERKGERKTERERKREKRVGGLRERKIIKEGGRSGNEREKERERQRGREGQRGIRRVKASKACSSNNLFFLIIQGKFPHDFARTQHFLFNAPVEPQRSLF